MRANAAVWKHLKTYVFDICHYHGYNIDQGRLELTSVVLLVERIYQAIEQLGGIT